MEKEWEVTVSVTGVIVLPFDEDDTQEIVKQYLGRADGRGAVIDQFKKLITRRFFNYILNGYPVDIDVEDIELVERKG